MSTDLIEVMPFEYQIVESANGRFRVEGVFQRSDIENANKRVYPRTIWEKELKEARVREVLENRAMFGELDHPSDGKTSLKRVSHLITELQLRDDGIVHGAAEILPTPNGQILKALFESGAQIGISSRGSGSVQNGVVQEDFKLSTFDFVARPSTPGAIPRPVGEATRSTKSTGMARFFEDDEKKDELTNLDMDDVADERVRSFMDMLDGLDTAVFESSSYDINGLAQDVIELHNYVTETQMTPETIREVSGHLLMLGTALQEMAINNPEHGSVIADLLDKVDQTRGAIIHIAPKEITEEENMDKLEFIKARLNESVEDEEALFESEVAGLYNELNSLSDEELVALATGVESDRLREHLEGLDDDELIEAGFEAGVLEEDDAAAGDEEVTVQDLLDYVDHLEGQLQEASGIINELVEQTEAGGDPNLVMKYEAALGIIQETVERYQILQEAVGGEDRANQIMEGYISSLEANDGGEEYDGGLEEGVNSIERLLEDSASDSKMAEMIRLTEGALSRLGAN